MGEPFVHEDEGGGTGRVSCVREEKLESTDSERFRDQRVHNGRDLLSRGEQKNQTYRSERIV